jgi:hypothetical protein
MAEARRTMPPLYRRRARLCIAYALSAKTAFHQGLRGIGMEHLWSQALATSGRCGTAQNGSNKPIGNQWQTTATVWERIVRRGSSVRVRQSARTTESPLRTIRDVRYQEIRPAGVRRISKASQGFFAAQRAGDPPNPRSQPHLPGLWFVVPPGFESETCGLGVRGRGVRGVRGVRLCLSPAVMSRRRPSELGGSTQYCRDSGLDTGARIGGRGSGSWV